MWTNFTLIVCGQKEQKTSLPGKKANEMLNSSALSRPAVVRSDWDAKTTDRVALIRSISLVLYAADFRGRLGPRSGAGRFESVWWTIRGWCAGYWLYPGNCRIIIVTASRLCFHCEFRVLCSRQNTSSSLAIHFRRLSQITAQSNANSAPTTLSVFSAPSGASARGLRGPGDAAGQQFASHLSVQI